jgi:hypothetical protein
MFNPTVGSPATGANRRRLRVPLRADLAAARGTATTWQTTASKPRSSPSRPMFASTSCGTADGEPPSIPIDTQRPGRVGPLRGFLPRGLSNACPHAPSRTHAAADKGRRRTTLNKHGRSCLKRSGPVQPRDAHYKTICAVPDDTTRRQIPTCGEGSLSGLVRRLLDVHRAPVDWSAHFASTTSSIPTSGTLPNNDSECLASSRGT